MGDVYLEKVNLRGSERCRWFFEKRDMILFVRVAVCESGLVCWQRIML